MKKIGILLIALLVPALAMAGIRGMEPNTVVAAAEIRATPDECTIGIIAPDHETSDNELILSATIYIRTGDNKAVPKSLVEGAWMGTGPGNILASGSCTTNEDEGKCTLFYKTPKTEELPQIGIRILGVECPGLKYFYKLNSGFAWVTMK